MGVGESASPVGARGQAYVQADGKRHELLFTNRALADAERLTGKTVVRLVDRGAIGIADLVVLVHCGLEQARRESDPHASKFTMDDAWGILDAAGLLTVMGAVSRALLAVMTYRGDGEETVTQDPPA